MMNRKLTWTLITFTTILLISLFAFTNLKKSEQLDEETVLVTNIKQCISTHLNKEQHEPIQIVGLGDSLTVGIGDEKDEGGYIGKLEKKLAQEDCSVSIKNFSVKGYKTTDLLQHIEEEEVATAIADAHVIMFTIGANDLVTIAKEERMRFSKKIVNEAEKKYAKNIEKTLTNIRALNEDAHIYVIGFYNPFSDAIINTKQVDLIVTKWNNISENYTDKINNSYYVQVDDLFTEKINRYLADDNFHPNNLGYEKIAERLVNIIQSRSD